MALKKPDLARAGDFIWRSARLLDRQRFSHHILGADRGPALTALRAYQNPDGGFGNALEPDLRAPSSQPGATNAALEILDQLHAFDDPCVTQACDYLETITCADGGIPFILPSAAGFPRAPWWQVAEPLTGSIVFTALIAGLLHKNRVRQRWLDGATEFCWRYAARLAVEEWDRTGPELSRIGRAYEIRATIAFLDHVNDRQRANGEFGRLGRRLLDDELVRLDPDAPGEMLTPLHYAPSPQSLAHGLFPKEAVAAHLDAVAAGQREDGGWMFRWTEWNPATTLEWRGWLTVESLLVLRAYGKLS